MNKHRILAAIATLGPIGYLPARGTLATLCTLPLVKLLICKNVGTILQTLIIGSMCVVSWLCIEYALPAFGHRHDPGEIVLDEVCGCLITFYGIHSCSWLILGVGFALFRFFDIFKPVGISQFEEAPGAWGVMLDDIAAALYSLICLHVFIKILHWM